MFFLVISRKRVSLYLGLRVGYSELQFKIRSNFGQEAHNKGKELVDFSTLAYKFGIRKQHRATLADTISAEAFALIDIRLKPKLKQKQKKKNFTLCCSIPMTCLEFPQCSKTRNSGCTESMCKANCLTTQISFEAEKEIL
jgi:hypothetical protein